MQAPGSFSRWMPLALSRARRARGASGAGLSDTGAWALHGLLRGEPKQKETPRAGLDGQGRSWKNGESWVWSEIFDDFCIFMSSIYWLHA